MDVLLAEDHENPKVQRKTRHEINISPLNISLKGPFFQPVIQEYHYFLQQSLNL